MAVTFTSPATGAAVTGFTSPTYTLVAASPIKLGSKQWEVSALGGTQPGVTIHSASSPFTVTLEGPTAYHPPVVPGLGGLTKTVPMNRYVCRIRKGGSVTADGDVRVAMFEGTFLVPAGMDVYASAQLGGMVSLAVGLLGQQSAAFADSLRAGSL